MTAIPAAVAAAMHEGVARLDDDGTVTAVNAAMRAIGAVFGAAERCALATFGAGAAELAALRVGDEVQLARAGRSFAMRALQADGGWWLLLRETTAAERGAAAGVEVLRLRALAGVAGSLVHDFNNVLNAALGLAAQVQPHLRDPFDLQVLKELGAGTQQGAQLARALARLLAKPLTGRTAVPLPAIADEAVALAAKVAAQRSVALVREPDPPAAAPVVRTVHAEAVQAVWHGLLALCDVRPTRLQVAIARHDVALAPLRTRRCGRVRVVAGGLAPGAVADVLALAAAAPGRFAALVRAPQAASFAAAVFVQRRLGGDLQATAHDDVVTLDYDWPAVG